MNIRFRRPAYANVMSTVAVFIALGGGAYAAATIGAGDIKNNAVRSKHIKAGQVKTSDLGAGSVRGAQVADGSLGGADLGDNSVTGGQIDEGSLGKVGDADTLDGLSSQSFMSSDDAWAYVVASGVGFHASSGNLSVTHPATGEYCVVVSKRSSHKAAQATMSDPGTNKVVSVGTGHGSACNPLNTPTHDAIPVFIRTNANVAVDGNFTILIPAP